MRILVAEDDRITRASLARQLSAWGHEVVSSEDGEAAWERFSADQHGGGDAAFDMVISDWDMPRLAGVDLIKRIRAAQTSTYVYLILLTGRTDKADIVSGIEAGADDFISKPFDKEELRVRVLAGERVVRLERTLQEQNAQLQRAGKKLRQDLEAAARVQRAMLPRKLIATDHVRTAWRFISADELAGDALGFDLLDDRYLATYIIDVSGHGVPAALLSVTAMHALAPTAGGASLLRSSRRDAHLGPAQNPAAVLTDLNSRFSSADSDGRFLTVAVCVLDTHTGRLWFSRAGHPLPVILRNGACVRYTDAGGLPIGLMPDADYADGECQLEPGDKVVLYSDGVIEQQAKPGEHEGQEFTTPRLERLLERLSPGPGSELVDRVVETLEDWADRKSFDDDVSILCIDWLGPVH